MEGLGLRLYMLRVWYEAVTEGLCSFINTHRGGLIGVQLLDSCTRVSAQLGLVSAVQY